MDEQALGDRLSNGTVVGEFEIEAVIGQGGFGVVYRARHQHLGTLVALKEYLPAAVAVRTGLTVSPRNQSLASDYEDGLRRFKEEARRLVQFRSHPGIVTCLGFFEERGTAYLVMVYEEGLPLSELLTSREKAGRPLEQGELLRLAERLLDSLSTIHEAGVLHRDVKPSNILIRRADDWPVLIDFGAAKQDFVRYTKSNAPHTQGYAAIEQLEADGALGPWTDLYGLGAVLWRIVAGGNSLGESLVPVDALTRMTARFRRQEDPQPLAGDLGAGRFSSGVLDSIDRCLELEPADRPADCSELLEVFSVPTKDVSGQFIHNVQPDEGGEPSSRELAGSGVEDKPPTEFRTKPGSSEPRVTLNRGVAAGLLTLVLVMIGLEWQVSKGDSPHDDESAAGLRKSLVAEEAVGPLLELALPPPADVEWIRKSAEQGDKSSQVALTLHRMYQSVISNRFVEDFEFVVSTEDIEAAEWLHKAADQGDLQAQVWLGWMYLNGRVVPLDYTKAEKWFRQAAEQGAVKAQERLGWLYVSGWGVPQDDTKAIEWFSKAVAQGSWPAKVWILEAQVRLGDKYFEGRSVPQDYAEAEKWYRKAAERGSSAAQYMLGLMYLNGHGVPVDHVWAYTWTNLAAAQNYHKGVDYLDPSAPRYPSAREQRDRLLSEMTPIQISEAQSRSRKIAEMIGDGDP